jgi:hypothetical protein
MLVNCMCSWAEVCFEHLPSLDECAHSLTDSDKLALAQMVGLLS